MFGAVVAADVAIVMTVYLLGVCTLTLIVAKSTRNIRISVYIENFR